MSDRPTLADVAQLAGVHMGTASRALNAATADRVQAKTARRIQAAARQLGYAPNTFAQSLRRQESRSIGVLIPDLTNPFFPPIVRGVEDALSEYGFTGLIASTDNDHGRERTLFDSLVGRHMDAFIIGTAMRQHPLLTEAHQAGIKGVLVQRTTDQPLYSSVSGDDDSGVAQAIAHLVHLGHRQIGHVAGPTTISVGYRRARAFREAARDLGLPAQAATVTVSDSLSIEGGMAATTELLRSAPDVTAIFAGNDLMAVGVLRVLRARGIACPQQISVVGFNDIVLAGDLAPGLTTIHVPLVDVGREAALLLLSELRLGDADSTRSRRQILLPVELVVRQSTAPPPS